MRGSCWIYDQRGRCASLSVRLVSLFWKAYRFALEAPRRVHIALVVWKILREVRQLRSRMSASRRGSGMRSYASLLND